VRFATRFRPEACGGSKRFGIRNERDSSTRRDALNSNRRVLRTGAAPSESRLLPCRTGADLKSRVISGGLSQGGIGPAGYAGVDSNEPSRHDGTPAMSNQCQLNFLARLLSPRFHARLDARCASARRPAAASPTRVRFKRYRSARRGGGGRRGALCSIALLANSRKGRDGWDTGPLVPEEK